MNQWPGTSVSRTPGAARRRHPGRGRYLRPRFRRRPAPRLDAPAETLARISHIAQDHPLYGDFRVGEMFRLGRGLNPSWDQELAERRTTALGIPLQRKVKSLSGGQQAQVALAMALAKRAPLLVLDEPVASLLRLENLGSRFSAVFTALLPAR